ncbi:HAD family hydrolase [Roseateles sp. BYS96W]|uniref:phosphoglycolate phosphatase n=1 Tax=Pelomonas nitida TaxID=3299027 RepID=A0ABW7GCP1_9BURK
MSMFASTDDGRTGEIRIAVRALADRRVRHVLLDWDGTVVDSHEHITNAFTTAVCQITGKSVEPPAVKALIGRPVGEMFLAFGQERQLPDFLDRFESLYIGLCRASPEPLLPGILEMLQWLKDEEGIRLSITSNKRCATLQASVNSSGLASMFDRLLDGQTHSPKPSGSMGEVVMRESDVVPSELLVIGDSHVDSEFARVLNCPFLGLASHTTNHRIRADEVQRLVLHWRATEPPASVGGY